MTLHIAAEAAKIEPHVLARSGRRLVFCLAGSPSQRDRLRRSAAEASLHGLATIVHQPELGDLPLASWYANTVIIEDPAAAMRRGLTWKEIVRVTTPRGEIVLPGGPQLENELRRAGVRERIASIEADGGWTRLRTTLPPDMGEWSRIAFADAGNREVSGDRMNPRRNAHVNHDFYSWEADGPESLEAAREPIWLRWLDGMNHTGARGSSGGQVAADGVVIGVYRGESFARIRDGCLFNQSVVLACRDAFNGTLRWARPGGGGRLMAIGGGRFFAPGGHGVRAVDVADGRELFTVASPGRSVLDLRVTCETFVIAFGKGDQGSLGAYATTDGKPLWDCPIQWLQLAVAEERVVVAYTDKPLDTAPRPGWSIERARAEASADGLAALDLKTGKELWRVPFGDAPPTKSRRLKSAGEGVAVLWADNQLEIVDLERGATKWRIPFDPAAARSARLREPIVSLLPGGKLVIADTSTRLVDLRSGEVRQIHEQPLRRGLAEWCCGAGRFTAQMFLDLAGATKPAAPEELGSLGTSGTCGIGPAVAYHTVYMHTQGCGCSPAWGRTKGYVAAGLIDPAPSAEAFRQPGPLEQGPAFGRPPATAADGPARWPLARGNPRRSASIGEEIGGKLRPRWAAKIASASAAATPTAQYVWRSNFLYSTTLTPPVVAGGKVVFAAPMTHEVIALDAASGDIAWRFQADGPVDSAPALVQGRCVFGCRDGAAYCLDLTDGALCWRRRIAPAVHRINVFGQLENRFPVVGAAMPDGQGQVWFTAGFNGQQRVVAARLGLATGEPSEFRLLPRGSYANDMLVADDEGKLWLGHQPVWPAAQAPLASRMELDDQTQQAVWNRQQRALRGQPGPKPVFQLFVPGHLISADSELIGTARTVAPFGQMRCGNLGVWRPLPEKLALHVERIPHVEMVYRGFPAVWWTWDDRRLVGLRALFTPPTGSNYPWGANKEQKAQWPVGKPGAVFAVRGEKLFGGQIDQSLAWEAELGEIWAACIAGGKVLAAGPVYPDTPPPMPEPPAVLGSPPDKPVQIDPLRAKGRLHVLDAADGHTLTAVDLPATVVQDGLAIAGGRAYATCADGSVVCLE